MNILKTGCAAFGLVMLTACAGPNVNFDYDTRGDFGKYHTFDWYAAPKGAQAMGAGVANPLMDSRVRRIVETELGNKGFRKETTQDPDFLVIFHPTYEPYRRSGAHVGLGMGFGFGRFSAVGLGVPIGGGRFEPAIGNIVLEVKDFKTNQLVWRGEAEEVLDRQETPEDADHDVTEAVRKLLAKFPPP